MNDKVNKTSICSVVALEIIDYAKKTEAEQIQVKSLFNSLIDLAVIDIPQEDRMIVDTGSGTAIACSGPLEDALEDALFISITIRDEILKNNIHGSIPLYVQFGINLGAARVVKNAIVGEGIDEAQHIMRFASPNQILVSQVYYEMASKLTQEMAQMFEKYDMHALEHDVYAVRLLKDKATAVELPASSTGDSVPGIWQFVASKLNWKYVAYTFFGLAVLFVMAKQVLTPVEPIITLAQPPVEETPVKPSIKSEAKLAEEPKEAVQTAEPQAAESVQATQSIEDKPKKADEPIKVDLPKKAKVAQKKVTQKPIVKTETPTVAAEKPVAKDHVDKAHSSPTASETHTSTAAKPAESKTEKSEAKEKSGWQTFKDSVKQGSERKCTQAEISMNQCNK